MTDFDRLRRRMERDLPAYDRDFIREVGWGDIDDMRMVETRWASERRKPCRRGEYIVITLDSLNTLIVVNAANADNAVLWRAMQIPPERRDGSYIVTNGKVTATYEVQGGKVKRVRAAWLGDFEHE